EVGHMGLPRLGRTVLGGMNEAGESYLVVLPPAFDTIGGRQARVADQLAGLDGVVGRLALVAPELADFVSQPAGEPHHVAEPYPEGARGLDGDGVVVVGGGGSPVRFGGGVSVADGAGDAGDLAVQGRADRRLLRRMGHGPLDGEVTVVDRRDVTPD